MQQNRKRYELKIFTVSTDKAIGRRTALQ